ncbi:hypothetical protein HN51_006221 [Arachis hypogaea]|uniref:Uncharacterized protein LOC107486390 n=2 Tax=Arachis TaxID=3817 RepID=A0A6P4DBL2_ARADU|nr:uncharacterized protein LOC107486390 [Arachis duranensis]XP_025692265.1 uncharacterized protein LOC112794475 [Arachis hypogaea]QHO10294.1 uncharacterized protein DS421_14g488570 [Arachis hypogaea]
MGHSCFLLLLLSSLLFLSFVGHGFGRVALMETHEHTHSTHSTQEYGTTMRASFEVEDYADPQPNINPKNGYLYSPPPPSTGSPAPTPTTKEDDQDQEQD